MFIGKRDRRDGRDYDLAKIIRLFCEIAMCISEDVV